MFKKIFVILATVGLMIPSFALADSYGLDSASQNTGLMKPTSGVSASDAVPALIGNIIGVALSFVGAIFFLLTLYAGFLWMTAFGSSEKVDRAKDILQHAAIGLVIVLAAYAISKFVFSALTEQAGGSSGTAAVQGCCVNKNINTVCVPNSLQSACSDSDFTWTAGTCPSTCQ